MRNIRLALIGFLLAAALVPAGIAEAQTNLLQDIRVRGVLRVGTTGDYEPFSVRDTAADIYRGFDIDQADALAGALGVKLEFVQTNWSRLATDLQDGKFDLALGGVSVTLERAKDGFFSVAYLSDGKTPIARCADQERFSSLAEIDRADVRVIVNPGGTNERFARAHLKQAPISVFPDNRKIFDEIAAGHADVMLTDASETRFQAKRHPGVLCPIHPDQPFDHSQKAIWMQPDISLKLFVDTWLQMSVESGALTALRAKWFE